MNKGNDNSSRSRKNPSKPPISQFLKESGMTGLAFLGKCMQYFGIKTVFVFIFGMLFATILYVYAGDYLNRMPIINKLIKITNQAPELSGVPTTTVYQNVKEESFYQATATDKDNNLKEKPFRLKDPHGSGSKIDHKTGVLTLKMNRPGTYEITVIAKDKYDAIDYQTFTVTDEREICLEGYVVTVEGNDIKLFDKEFEIIVVGDRCGPFNKTTTDVGLFSVWVPFSKKYHIMVWPKNLKHLSDMYEITKIKPIGNNVYRVDGDLSLRLSD